LCQSLARQILPVLESVVTFAGPIPSNSREFWHHRRRRPPTHFPEVRAIAGAAGLPVTVSVGAALLTPPGAACADNEDRTRQAIRDMSRAAAMIFMA
jgi:hypothetical protein